MVRILGLFAEVHAALKKSVPKSKLHLYPGKEKLLYPLVTGQMRCGNQNKKHSHSLLFVNSLFYPVVSSARFCCKKSRFEPATLCLIVIIGM